MTVTSTGLTRAAEIALAIAGAIFVAVQINHPPMTAASVETTEWMVRDGAKVVMSGLTLFGLTGLYLRQYGRLGLFGLVGYLLFTLGNLTMFSVETIATVVLPRLTDLQPGYVNDVVVVAFGGKAMGDIGALATWLQLSGACYLLGGLLFGIALFRAAVVTRWASALLALGAVGTGALAVLPDSFNRPMAVPLGIALLGLGVSLWRNASEDVETRSETATSEGTARRQAPVPAVR